MKLKDAIKRLSFTISKTNKPNQTDAESYNTILEHLHKVEEKTIQDNLLFAKLYSFLLDNFVKNYGCVNFANKEINKILSQPLNHRIEMLGLSLKFMELQQIIPDPILKGKSKEELDLVFETHNKFKDQFVSAWDWWNTENTKSHLETNINLSIQNFKNYV